MTHPPDAVSLLPQQPTHVPTNTKPTNQSIYLLSTIDYATLGQLMVSIKLTKQLSYIQATPYNSYPPHSLL